MCIPSVTAIIMILVQSVFSAYSVVADSDSRQEIDLASDTAWTLRCDDGPTRPIKVPGGGWNSDQQRPAIPHGSVKDAVSYERSVKIPATAAGQAIILQCGAVNYGAEVYWDGKKVGEHHGPMMPFEVDLTPCAVPGKTHTLTIKAFHRRHYIDKSNDICISFLNPFWTVRPFSAATIPA